MAESSKLIKGSVIKIEDKYAIVLPEKWDSTGVLKDADFKDLDINILRTRLPMVFINTESGTMDNIDKSLDKSVQEKGRIVVVDADGNIIDNKKIDKIHGRGRFSWEKDPKKGYNICLSKKIKIPGLKSGASIEEINNGYVIKSKVKLRLSAEQ